VSSRKSRERRASKRWPLLATIILVVVVLASAVVLYHPAGSSATQSSSSGKYVILYVNQGNGVVNESNFGSMLSFASVHGFNTIFFQVYREGDLLFNASQLSFFVSQAHAQRMKVFFSVYITSGAQMLPVSIYNLGEDGISLDMSTLPFSDQSSFFSSLKEGYTSGLTAITTTNLTLSLSPDLLVLETYASQVQQYSLYVHPGVILSVGVFATTSQTDYQQEFQYSLANSDGVMVFDYAGLMKSGY
jgi:hypothetical protein